MELEANSEPEAHSEHHQTSTMERFAKVATYNQFHNILRFFDVLPNFRFSTSETMRDYYLQTCYIRVASQVGERLKTYDLSKLGNIKKVSKLYKMIA